MRIIRVGLGWSAAILFAAVLSAREPQVYRAKVDPHWFAEKTRFWYRNDLKDGEREFVLVDAEKGVRRLAFDHAKTADALGRFTKKSIAANRLPVDWLAFDDDMSALVLHGPKEAWRLDLKSYGIAPFESAPQKKPEPKAEKHRHVSARGPTSPDGRWVAFVKNGSLFLRAKSGGGETRLAEGRDGDGYHENELFWSPDSKKLAAIRINKAQDHPIHIVESSPSDRLQPKLRTLNYLKPGDRVAVARPELFDAGEKKPIPVSNDLFSNPWSVGAVRWAADSSRFTFEYNQRGHQVYRVLAVDAKTGQVRPIVDEASPTFICYSQKHFCDWLGDRESVWMSERDGWNHLWLYDAESGRVKNQITHGDWVVQRVVHIDAEHRQVWFTAGGIRPGQDPYYSHFCRVDLDGKNLTVLTEGNGDHRTQWSPGDRFFIDSWSRPDAPPVTELRRSGDGSLVCRLEEADASQALAARGGRWPEPFVAKGRDGQTDIFGVIVRPRDFDPKRKYPVIEHVYAGPHSFFAQKSFRALGGHMQAVADLGAIVVQADGMGTSGRSKKFHDVCWQNLRDAGFPDRIAWIKAAAAVHPEMDATRVGIYGGSAGGQSAMAALIWHNDFYQVAVADCGCHDNRMDKIWWNEQWLGWPVGKQYEENSNLVHADRLKGRLMLVVGELDDNVDPATTMQVAGKLQKANVDFELVVVVGNGHGAAESPYGSRKRADFFLRNLIQASRERPALSGR